MLGVLLIIASCLFIVPAVRSDSSGNVVSKSYPHFYVYGAERNTFTEATIKLPETAASLRATFLTDPPAKPFRSHSQSMQDLVLLNILDDKNGGYFVDLATNDYQFLSNTYALEYFNKWNGVCIEPNPKYLEGLLSNRKCHIFTNPVSATNNESVTFRFSAHGNGVFGGIVGDGFDNTGSSEQDVTLATTTLTSILDFVHAPTTMEYLSLDVEGAEIFVLQGLDMQRYRFLFATVERPTRQVHELLTQNEYRFVFLMAHFGECLYMHRSFSRFDAIMEKYRVRDSSSGKDIVPEFFGRRPYLLNPPWPEAATELLSPMKKRGVDSSTRARNETTTTHIDRLMNATIGSSRRGHHHHHHQHNQQQQQQQQ
mmetsp:Transcript_5607/g.9207  ORF Transcript_5607/g.9207 Transcript_5607/m.9207 type:complete len:369 (-) Transcript_5607:64-1170(-)